MHCVNTLLHHVMISLAAGWMEGMWPKIISDHFFSIKVFWNNFDINHPNSVFHLHFIVVPYFHRKIIFDQFSLYTVNFAIFFPSPIFYFLWGGPKIQKGLLTNFLAISGSSEQFRFFDLWPHLFHLFIFSGGTPKLMFYQLDISEYTWKNSDPYIYYFLDIQNVMYKNTHTHTNTLKFI